MLRMLGRLLRTHLRPYRRVIAVVVLFQLLGGLALLYLPSLSADIIDNGVLTGDTGYIWARGALMLAVSLLQVVFSVSVFYLGSRTASGFGRDLRAHLFHTVTGYSAREVADFGAPSLITRITNDVQQVQMLAQLSLTMLMGAPLMVVGGIVMAMREDVGLSVILLVTMPVMIGLVSLMTSRMIPQFRFMQVRIDRINEILREQLSGMRVIRAFVREPDEVARFAQANEDITETALAAGRLMAFMFPIVALCISLSSTAAVWIAGDRVAAGDMQVGALIAYLTYLFQILMSLMMVNFLIILLPRSSVCADRIQLVLDTPSTVVEAAEPVRDLPTEGLLELDGVGFHYPGAEAPVLSSISVQVRAGETLAVIGSTGAGKTTLLNLVPRLFDVTSGVVRVDGVDVRDLALTTLWARVGLVPQRPYLFSGTVASNLRFGDPDATDEQLWEALEIAQARDFVTALPDQLESPIDQGGANLSGGQRQRLSIARALIRRPDIYLFDDSFSALDLATDARLRAALAPYTARAAKVIVAQRVSTIRDADQILVLEDGLVVGLGDHDDLVAGCPTYAEIVASQHRAEEAA
jgi:ATP-binding cassette subfamily B multidrug efflux pump